MPLTLFRDERGDYRFNLSSGSPRLFVTGSRVDSGFVADGLTLSQTVAAAYMDGEQQVLSCPLPEALQAWVEAFIGRHGELLEARRKGKKGKGRAQDQLGVDTVDQASCGAVKATGPMAASMVATAETAPMSEFLKRWSSRKSEARKHQVLQPREEVSPEAVAAPIEGSGEAETPDTALDSPVVSTDKGSREPLAVEGAESGESPLITAQPGKAKLPDREALRAMFRSHKRMGSTTTPRISASPNCCPRP